MLNRGALLFVGVSAAHGLVNQPQDAQARPANKPCGAQHNLKQQIQDQLHAAIVHGHAAHGTTGSNVPMTSPFGDFDGACV